MKTSTNITIRKSDERGHANHGWLDSHFTFSFAEYHDSRYMGFRTLRVINEDVIEPGQGFGTHPHRDMEIISYVVEGELAHKDSMGTVSVIKAGNLQRMTAGKGVAHSEYNPSSKNPTHLLQIWILPEQKGLEPSYEELNIRGSKTKNALQLVAARDAKVGVLKVHQDVSLYSGMLDKGKAIDYRTEKGRGLWLQMVKGKIDLNGMALNQGDGASVENEQNIRLKGAESAEFLLFDLK